MAYDTTRLLQDLLQARPDLEDVVNEIKPYLNDDVNKFFESLITSDEAYNAMLADFLDILSCKDITEVEAKYTSLKEEYAFLGIAEAIVKNNEPILQTILSVANKVIEINNAPKPTPINNPLYELFISTYKEFADVEFAEVIKMFAKIACIYSKYKNLTQTNTPALCDTYPFFMLVAHYLSIEGKAEVSGSFKGNGVVASSSIDGVSVSYAAPVYKDNFQYFFTQTPYGQEYLAYLASNNSMMYVNNVKNRM